MQEIMDTINHFKANEGKSIACLSYATHVTTYQEFPALRTVNQWIKYRHKYKIKVSVTYLHLIV